MMKKSGIGIVLRTLFPVKQKIILFDRVAGKIEVAVPDIKIITRITNGALLEYALTDTLRGLSLHEVEYINVPFPLARADVIFLHHVLELARYFVPLESPHQELYELLLLLYYDQQLLTDAYHKKLFLVRFFVLIGLYPEKMIQDRRLYRLISLPIAVMLKEKVDQETCKIIRTFLQECMSACPNIKDLKTVSFIG